MPSLEGEREQASTTEWGEVTTSNANNKQHLLQQLLRVYVNGYCMDDRVERIPE